ncbi:hypothetical protein HanIR_Chr15g0780441 [Helianthus annuus]|nr:hypothetical protein HanIR_Chr15g0780441 [Helianthus annuus]
MISNSITSRTASAATPTTSPEAIPFIIEENQLPPLLPQPPLLEPLQLITFTVVTSPNPQIAISDLRSTAQPPNHYFRSAIAMVVGRWCSRWF